jgi:hypothetical protein
VSIEVMDAVWRFSEHKGSALLTLLAISDNANSETWVAYPTYDQLAGKTRLSKRSVQDQVAAVVASGELSLLRSGTRGRANEYRVNVDVLRSKESQVAKSATSNPSEVAVEVANPGGTQAATQPSGLQPSVIQPSEENLVAGGDGQLFGTPDEKPGPQSEEPVPIHEDDAIIQGIWDHFVRTIAPTQTQLTPSRRRLIAKALKETQDAEHCKAAISGLKAWRKKKPGDSTLSAVFSTRPGGAALADQIQWWAQQAGEHGTHVPSVTDDRVVRRQLEVRQMFEQPHLAGVRERGEQALAWLKENAQMDVVQQQDGTLKWVEWTGDAA